VTPVYNENPKLFRLALQSWKENQPDEIIAVIDHSDFGCIEEFRKFQASFSNGKLIITRKPGKRPALADGVKGAQSTIIALVDSDTIWDRNILPKMLLPFTDPFVGGVAPRQQVFKPDTLARRLFDIRLDDRYLTEMAYLSVLGNGVTCLSGRTVLYRKEAIVDLVDEMVNETFLGKKCISGDDKCLTNLVQANQWKVCYQSNAHVFTPGAQDLLTFFKQNVRWARNSWRADLKAISSRWIWNEPFLAFHLCDRFVQPLTLLLGPIFFIFAVAGKYWLITLMLMAWWGVSRGLKILPHLLDKPTDLLLLPLYVVSTYALAIIRIYALLTLNKQGWITRWDGTRLRRWSLLKAIPSYVGTVSIMFLLAAGVEHYKLSVAKTYTSPRSNGINENQEWEGLSSDEPGMTPLKRPIY
jgi:hyaluronan synthase